MANTARKTSTARKTNTARKDAEREKRSFNNTITDFEVSNIRSFTDHFGNSGAYFTLDLGFLCIYSMMIMENSSGEYYITFPADVGGDNCYHKRGYIEDSALTEAIIEELDGQF